MPETIKTVKEFNKLSKQAKEFFESYQSFLENRLEKLPNARAASSRISKILAEVSNANCKRCIEKINSLNSSDDNVEILSGKIVEYLLRAEDTLRLQFRNSDYGADFVPNPFHQAEYETIKSVLEKLYKIYADHNIDAVNISNNRAWYTPELREASLLVCLRVLAHGAKKSEQASVLAVKLFAKGDDWDLTANLRDAKFAATKQTRTFLELSSKDPNEEPNSVDYQAAIPRGMTQLFKNFSEKSEKEGRVSNESFDSILEFELPKAKK